MSELELTTKDKEKYSIRFEIDFENEIDYLSYSGGYFNADDFIINNRIACMEYNELIEDNFYSDISKNDKWEYIAAVSSGILCAAIDIFFIGEFDLQEASNWGSDKINEFVIFFAKMKGFKGDDIKGAIEKLETLYELPSDKIMNEYGGGAYHHLRDFSHHPTILGLFFSVLSQLTHKGFGVGRAGEFIIRNIPEEAFEAEGFVERMYHGVFKWMGHLISDMAGSSHNPGEGSGIPGVFLSFFKEISSLPIFNSLNSIYEGKNNELSDLIRRVFDGSLFVTEGEENKIKFDLRAEIGFVKEISRQALPIILNECIVRSIFTLRRFYMEVKEKNIHNYEDLIRLDYLKILPYRNVNLNRMLTIASGTFSVLDISHAAAFSYLKNLNVGLGFIKDFLIRINIMGVGRLAIACKVEVDTFFEKQALKRVRYEKIIPEFSQMTLDYMKIRILYSLYMQKCYCDINQTRNMIEKETKKKWVEEWKAQIIENLAETGNFYIDDLYELKQVVADELEKTSDDSWMYIIFLEVSLFTPYYILNTDLDEKFKKLKLRIKNINNEFLEIQNYVTENDMVNILKTFEASVNALTGKTAKLIASATSIALVTVITGGVGFINAPLIATALLGNTFAGISGIALTNMSLAAIGGGSLAAGGLGMAGGTAIIAGGGAMLGFAASTSITTLASGLLGTNSDYTLYECSKLLTFIRFVVLDKHKQSEVVLKFADQLNEHIKNYKQLIEEIPKDIENYSKIIKDKNLSIKYLSKTKKCIEDNVEKFEKELRGKKG